MSVRVLLSGFVPIAVGGMVLAEPLVRFLFPPEYQHSGLLFALGIWRAPILSLAFLYQSSLIAMNRESAGSKLLVWGALLAMPLIGGLRWQFGLPGASIAVLVLGLGLIVAGYSCLFRERRHPAVHHHLARPLAASALMVPVCLGVLQIHVALAVAAGGLTYLAALKLMGGLDFRRELSLTRERSHRIIRIDSAT
jgi:O-antigen/teichoic acid export membrane protein